MAAVLPPQTMSSGFPSLISRRGTAGGNLPGPLELPVNHLTAKFGGPLSSSSLPTVINNQQSQSNINALLTPPSNISGDSLSPISSGTNSSSNAAAIGLPPYTPTGYAYSSGPYPAATGSTPQPSIAHSWNSSVNQPARGRFSPSLASLMRNPSSGPPDSSMPPLSQPQQAPSYDLGALPPFPHQSGPVSPPTHHQSSMPYGMSSQSSPPLASPVSVAHDPYMHQKLPPTPGYYQSMTPQQSHFPPQYSSASPPMQSPLSTTAPGTRLSPITQPMQGFNRPYPGLQMQGLGSPGHMPPNFGSSAFHQPLFNSGHAAQLTHIYGGQQGQPPMDRPFKCDQCPQSFNRNHDLKRHKRIHLAVKPFPCKYCDKSFSRKDALKRHILVKGCGKGVPADSKANDSGRDESSSGEQSPVNHR